MLRLFWSDTIERLRFYISSGFVASDFIPGLSLEGCRSRITILTLYISTFSLLLYSYEVAIVPGFGSEGFEWTPSTLKIAESFMVLLLFGLFLPSRVNKPSDFLLHFHFLWPILPMLILYSTMNLSRIYIAFACVCFAIVCASCQIGRIRISRGFIFESSMVKLAFALAAINILGIILEGGLRYFNLNFMRVYEFRDLAAEELSALYGYFSPMTATVLLPFLVVRSVSRRQWISALLAILGSIMICGLTSHKSVLFYPILVICMYYILQHYRKYSIVLLLIAYNFTIAICTYLNSSADDLGSIASSIFLRRVYFTPSLLNFYYFDFFSSHPLTLFSESRISMNLVDYPYFSPSANMIGSYYLSNPYASANTGWLGSGFMQLGFLGMLLYAFLIGRILSFVDSLGERRGLALCVAFLCAPLSILFQSSDLPTTMLTHGLLLALFLLWALKREDFSKVSRNFRTIHNPSRSLS